MKTVLDSTIPDSPPDAPSPGPNPSDVPDVGAPEPEPDQL